MNRDAQDSLILFFGATMLVIGATDLHLRYVKPAMQPLVLLAGLVLLGVGLRGLFRTWRRDATRAPIGSPAHEDDRPPHAPTRAAWLLSLPICVLALIAPPSLGAYAAARTETTIGVPTEAFPPLPAARAGSVDLTLTDFYSRVLYEPGSLDGQSVRLTGFVTPVEGRWFVTRIALSCCAADGRPIKVLVSGKAAEQAPPSDTWVEVVGTSAPPQTPPGGQRAVATLEVLSVQTVPEPSTSYE